MLLLLLLGPLLLGPLLRQLLCLQLCRLLRRPLLPRLWRGLPSLHLLLCIAVAPAKSIVLLRLLLLLCSALA